MLFVLIIRQFFCEFNSSLRNEIEQIYCLIGRECQNCRRVERDKTSIIFGRRSLVLSSQNFVSIRDLLSLTVEFGTT